MKYEQIVRIAETKAKIIDLLKVKPRTEWDVSVLAQIDRSWLYLLGLISDGEVQYDNGLYYYKPLYHQQKGNVDITE